MKKSKYLFPIASVLLAIGLFALTAFSTPKKSKIPSYWFNVNSTVYAGSSLNGASISNTFLQTTNTGRCGLGVLYDCQVAFPGYYFNGEIYFPARNPFSRSPLSPALYDIYVVGPPTISNFH